VFSPYTISQLRDETGIGTYARVSLYEFLHSTGEKFKAVGSRFAKLEYGVLLP